MKPSWIKAVIKMKKIAPENFTLPIFCYGGGHESGEMGEGERQPRCSIHPSNPRF